MVFLFKLMVVSFLSFYNHLQAQDYTNKQVDSAKSRLLLENLKASWKLSGTTAYRKEYKSVVLKDSFLQFISNLNKDLIFNQGKIIKKNSQSKVHLEKRDKNKKGYINQTLTFYGRSLFFYNLGVKTKVKFRVRLYLNFSQQDKKVIWSKKNNNFVFLELKVKNPSLLEQMGVHKYRVKLAINDLKHLYAKDVTSSTEERFFTKIDHCLQKQRDDKISSLMIKIFVKALRGFAKESKDFLRPLYAISYQRQAYRIKEPQYLTKKSLMAHKDLGPMEYQMTADEKIKVYRPKLKTINTLGLKKYILDFLSKDLLTAYPEDAVVLEVKVPGQVAAHSLKKMSDIHRNIYKKIIKQMHLPANIYMSFETGRGKASFARKFLNKNHSI